MRILVDYTSAIRQSAGIGRITQELIRNFPWQRAGLKLSLFVSGRRGDSLAQVNGVKLHFTPFRERDMTRLWHRARSLYPKVEWFADCRPEIFHATDFALSPSSATLPNTYHPRFGILQIPGSVRTLADPILGKSRATERSSRRLPNR